MVQGNKRGPDPSELESEISNPVKDEEFTFNGVDGLGYEDFLQQVRRVAFNEGKSRDASWMADLAVLHLSGEALTWFETLFDDVQQDWNLLKRAIFQKYGGKDVERETGDGHPPNTPMSKSDEQNVTPAFDPLLPARINIANWGTPVLASTIRFPMSEEGWLNEGRQRRSKFAGKQGVVYWHLVEPSDSVPENAICSGSEYSVQVYSIRAWHEGGLTLGKLSTQVLLWRSKRAWIVWSGKEIPWSGPFEVLVGDHSAVRWIKPQSSGPFKAVEGGFEAKKGKASLVARFDLGTMIQPGKAFAGEPHGSYGWWLKEYYQGDFRVLAWK
ncbi:hypothetical protein FRC04_005265 [Tulasnella sp. 424]|nr:hypothetical protein FRC04_005265 [Tulasnella sp. 424]